MYKMKSTATHTKKVNYGLCHITLCTVMTFRISSLVERLCLLYGTKITVLDGTTWHSFPNVSSLADDGVEETLRAQGFGYR